MFLSPGIVETSSKSLKSQEFSFIDVTIALAEKLNCTNLVKIYIRLDEKFLVPIHRVAASSNVDCVTTNEFTFYLCWWYILLMQALRVVCAVCSPIPSFIIFIWENRLITILIKIDCYVCWLLSDSVWSFESWSFAYFNVILISLSRRSICWNWHCHCHCYCHCHCQCHWARSFHGIRIIHLIIVMVHLCIKQSSNYVIWLNNAWNCSIQSSKVWFNVIECMEFLWQILPL